MVVQQQSTLLGTVAVERDELMLDFTLLQGSWSEAQYLALTDHTNYLIEFTDGFFDVLPMPTDRHQTLLAYLYLALLAFVGGRGGKVRILPLRLQIRPGKYREPDILLLLDAHDPRRQDRFWLGADLVVEIVSPDKPKRDLVDKRRDYAEAKVAEYWITNPQTETITVLRLEGDSYVEHGMFGRGTTATSALLLDFAVNVDAVFAAP